MSTALKNLAVAARVTLTVAVVQAVVETAAVAAIYSGLILAPLDFFDVRFYDGFAKIYFAVLELFGAAATPGMFIAQGIATKAAILPPLLAINVGVAAAVALLASVLGPAVGLASRSGRHLDARRLLWALIALELVVHLALWATNVHLPKAPTLMVVAKNYTRNFLYDGTIIALAVLAATALASRWALLRMGARAAGASLAVLAVVVAAAAMTNGGATPEAEQPVSARPPDAKAVAKGYNVVFVSIDTVRADHTSAYGYQRETTPTIAAWARDGVRFANTSSTAPWTLPAHLSMFSGRSQLGHGVLNDRHALPQDVRTLTEVLHEAGYTTGAVVSAPYLSRRYGFARGFDDYDDETIQWHTHGESYKHITAPILHEAATAWLAEHADQRFFLFLHYWDPHYDYAPGPPYDEMFDPDYQGSLNGDNFYFNPAVNQNMDRRDLDHIIALYDGEIRLVDDHLGKLKARLSELGVADHTIIVVTSDHGEEFFEHGHKGHRRSLYDESIRVPLVIYVPGVTPTKPVVDMEVSLIDLAPTILDLVGAPPLDGAEGASLAAIAFGDQPESARPTVAELYRSPSLNVQVAMQAGDHKIIQHFNRPLMESYDTSADPHEQEPLPNTSAVAADIAEDLVAWLNQRWPEFRRRSVSDDGNRLDMDEETQERLRALGYAQ